MLVTRIIINDDLDHGALSTMMLSYVSMSDEYCEINFPTQ